MTTHIETTGGDQSLLIDRLVCGELNGDQRRTLLAWLDEQPQRWRLCGLAFLEAQAWQESCQEWDRAADLVASGSAFARLPADRWPASRAGRRESVSNPQKSLKRAHGLRGLALAGCVLAAFAGGTRFQAALQPDVSGPGPAVVHDAPKETGAGPAVPETDDSLPVPNKPILASLDVPKFGGLGPSSSIRVPVLPADSDDTGPPLNEIPEDIRRQWERRGFKLSLEQRYLFARLPDGKPVVLPVSQVQADRIPVTVN